ncbi:MAG: metallophosphoesterase [Sphaerochaetaceae bacterium]
MDRIFVFSDLHGNGDALKMLLSRASEESCDHIICAGDLGLDRLGQHRNLLQGLKIPFSMVRGNCDSVWTFSEAGFSIPPKYTVLNLGNRIVFVTHGDAIPSWYAAPTPLSEKDIFISGHTHIAFVTQTSTGPVVMNPGSASSPRDNRPPSYAVITDREILVKALVSRRVMEALTI